MGQSYDLINTPRQYYFNNFSSVTPSTPTTYFPGANFTRSTNATIGMVSTGINGNTLSSLALNKVGYLQWSFMSNTGAGGVGLSNAVWEWEFDYKNVGGTVAPGDASNTISASSTAATDSWRYWLIANSYVGTNSTLGLFVTVSGTNLKLMTKYNAANAALDNGITIPLPVNNNVYQIRIVKNATGAYYIYVYNKTTLALSTYNNGGGGYQIGNSNTVNLNTYDYSFLECSSTTADRFQWDNFNFYQQKLEYVPIIGSDYGITPAVYPGIVDAIPYGVKVNVRGDIVLGRFVTKATGDSQALFESGALWKTTNSVLSTASPASKLKDLNVWNTGTSQFELPSTETYYSTGNGDGNTATMVNYFLVLKGRNPFYSSYPSSISWSVSATADDNYSQAYTSNVTPITPTTGGTTAPANPNGDVYDWTGTNPLWSTSGSWKRNTQASTLNPSANTDIVRFGVVPYTGSNSPQLAGNINVGLVQIGKYGSVSTSSNIPVSMDMAGKKLTISSGLVVNSDATLALSNSSTTDGNIAVSGTSTIAGTGRINFPTTNKVILANSGTLTLLSTANGTGSIGNLYTSSVTGTVTVQRYFTGGGITKRGWRLLSTPVNNSSNLPVTSAATANFTSFKTNLPITGTGGSANGWDQPNGYTVNGATLLFYNNAGKGTFSTPTQFSSTTVKAGEGFYFYFRGSNSNALGKLVRSGGSFSSPEADVVGLQTGTLNQQNFTYTLANTGTGFNLVGNPYPSSITIPADTTALRGTTGFVYTYTPGGSSVSTTSLPATIGSGQGFYVKANRASSSIVFTETLKTSGQPLSLLMGAPLREELAGNIKLQMVQDSLNYDFAQLRFSKDYTENYVDTEDADDLNGSGQAVFFGANTADKHQVAIASQPLNEKKTSVFLSVNGNASGNFAINKVDVSNIPDKYDVWLMDRFKKDSIDLRTSSTYSFSIDKTNPSTFGDSRFEVVIGLKKLPPYQLASFTGDRSKGTNTLKWKTQNEYTYTYFELERSLDNKIFEGVNNSMSTSKGDYSFVDKTAATNAVVYYRLKQTDIYGTTYTSVIIIQPEENKDNVFSLYPNPVSNFIKFDIKEDIKGPISMAIYNSMGLRVISSVHSSKTGQENLSSLLPGSYMVELVDATNKKRIASTKFIKL